MERDITIRRTCGKSMPVNPVGRITWCLSRSKEYSCALHCALEVGRGNAVRKLGRGHNIERQADDLRGIHTVCGKRSRSAVRFLRQGASLEEGFVNGW